MSSLLELVKIVILSLANKREVTLCDNIRYLNYPTVGFGPSDQTNFQKHLFESVQITFQNSRTTKTELL